MYAIYISFTWLGCLHMSACISHSKIHSFNKANNNYMNETSYNKEYVGLGYDAVFGIPFGAASSNLDSGYRNAIIDTKPSTGNGADTDSYANSVWKRELSTCWHSDSRKSMKEGDIANELQNEFQMEGAETNELLKANIAKSLHTDDMLSSSSKYVLKDSFCVIKESGIVVPFKGKLSSFFVKDVESLPQEIKGLKECPPDVFLKDPLTADCKDIRLWIRFFKRYGTHITEHIVTGGKIMYIDKMASVENSGKQKVDISVTSGTKQTNFESTLKGSRQSRKMWIMGGYYVSGLESNDLHAFKKWFQNLWRRPMPIRGRFASLEHFVGNKAGAYHQAFTFYKNIQRVANGHSLNNVSFTEMIKDTVTVSADDAIVSCPENMVVAAGFVIKDDWPLQIDACITERTYCSSDIIKRNGVSVAICAKGGSFKMKSFASNTRTACPKGLVIAAGFQVYRDISSTLQIAACPEGERDCGDIPGTDGIEWKICVPANILEPNLTAITGGTKRTYIHTAYCPPKKKVILG